MSSPGPFAGAWTWQRDGMGEPAAVRASTEDYRVEMDVLAAFLADRCVQTPNATASVNDLYADYRGWCEATREWPLKQRQFSARMKERGFESKHTNKGNVWQGIGLRIPVTNGDAWSTNFGIPLVNSGSHEEITNFKSDPSPYVTVANGLAGGD